MRENGASTENILVATENALGGKMQLQRRVRSIPTPPQRDFLSRSRHAEAAWAIIRLLPFSAIQTLDIAGSFCHQDDQMIFGRWRRERLYHGWVVVRSEQQRAPASFLTALRHRGTQVPIGFSAGDHTDSLLESLASGLRTQLK